MEVNPMLSSLRLLRLTRGKTLYETAKEIGISAARLSYIERGIEEPKESELKKLTAVLDIPDIRTKGQ